MTSKSSAPGWDATTHQRVPTCSSLPENTEVPVLVCGAGPVGLVMGLLLDQFDVPSLVVSRHQGPSLHPKARGITARTMEVLARAGLASELESVAGEYNAGGHVMSVITSLTGEPTRTIQMSPTSKPPEEADTRWPGLLLGQDRLESHLVETCARRDSVDLRFSTELADYTDHDDHVEATVVDQVSGRRSTVRCGWLIGCDGPRSLVRSAARIPFTGEFDLERHVNVLFEADLELLVRNPRTVAYAIEGAGIPCTLLAVDQRRWLLNFQIPEGDPVTAWTADHAVRKLLTRVIGRDDIPATILSTVVWAPSAAVAGSYRRNRVFLAGDAAHVMPPNGAMGANTGIQDADNLAWKLAMRYHGMAGDALLDTYEQERRPIGVRTVGQALAMFRTPGGVGAPGRVPAEITLDYRYSGGAFVPDGVAGTDALTGKPGHRAPHVLVRRDPARSLHDDLGPWFTLLCVAGDAGWANAIAGWTGVPMKHVELSPELDARVSYAYPTVTRGGAVLVRPDGVVAWTASDQDKSRIPSVLRRILGQEIA